MLSGIVNGTPIWVWPLLIGLIWLGWRSSKDRSVVAAVTYMLPLLGILSLRSVHGLAGGNVIWLAFALSYCGGALWGQGYQRRLVLSKASGRVQLRGEWMSLVAFMLIFGVNFAGGMARKISPEIYGALWFQLLFAGVAGLVGGTFLGRAYRVWRYESASTL